MPVLRDNGTQVLNLFKLVVSDNDEVTGSFTRPSIGPSLHFEFVARRNLDEMWCAFRAGGGVHVIPGGDLAVYCSSYQSVPGENLVAEEWAAR